MRHVSITFPTFWVKPHGIFPHPVEPTSKDDGPQLAPRGRGADHRGRQRLPGLHGDHPQVRGHHGEGRGWGRHEDWED